MRKFVFAIASAAALVSAPAMAADLGRPIYKAPVIAAAPYFNWSGCYIGVHGGGGFGQKRWTDPALGDFEFSRHDVDGAFAGGQIGCDWQAGTWVFGVEGSGSWANITGSGLDILSPGGITLRDRSTINAIGTFTGRIGWAWDRTLLYVKGGGAVVGDRFRTTCEVAVGACFGFPIGTTFARADDTRFGWLVGAGIEYAFTPNWSVKLEYNFMDFGRESATFSGPVFAGAPFDYNIDQYVHVVKAGINYRFNWGGGGVMAAY